MVIRSLFSIVEKDLKILGRSKFSAFAIILTPLLIILFAGFAFNSSSLSGIIVGTYSDSYTDLTENVLMGFKEQNFEINKFSSQEECIDSVKLSKAQICIIFPDDLSATGSVENVVFHVDHSRINLAYTLIQDIESKISLKASSLGTALAQELIDLLQSAKKSLPEQQLKISDSMTKLGGINENARDTPLSFEVDNALNYLDTAKDLLVTAIEILKKKEFLFAYNQLL